MSWRVLVEGDSDRIAVEALARRLGRDLAAEGVSVVAIGGAHAIGRFLEGAPGVRVAGLCDAGELPVVRRAVERAGVDPGGFYVCDADLEDELIRALGAEAVEGILAAEGELRSFRTLQHQPAQRGRPVEAQLRRFLGARSGHKKTYARLLVEALDLRAVPQPLAGLLAHVA